MLESRVSAFVSPGLRVCSAGFAPASAVAVALAAVVIPTSGAAQQAATLFDAPLVAFDQWTSIRKVADLDGDGRVEALGWWYTNNYSNTVHLSTYRQDQAGRWSLAWRETTSVGGGTLRPPVLDVGNFDGDNRTDWAISMRLGIRVYTSQPDGTPALLWSTNEADSIERLLVLDFSGDGRDDLAVVIPGSVRLWRNDGASFTLAGTATIAALAAPSELEPGDVDSDSTPDLLLSDATTLRLIRIVNGVPVPVSGHAHGLNEVKPACGDIDGDGDRDIVLWGMAPDRYVVMRRTGPTTFVQEASAVGGPARYLKDIDGDGDLDGVCCGGGGPYPTPNKTASMFRIARNDQGLFAPAIEIPAMGSERLAAAIDLDGDGDLDLVGGRCIYYARGPIRRAPHTRMPGWNLETQFHDVEGDGDIDLRVRMGAVERNSADGKFDTANLIFPAASAGTFYEQGGIPGDFDGDGDVDLLVRHMQGSQLISMRLMRNVGGAFHDGGAAGPLGMDFHPMREWQTDSITNLPADLDGDGDLDLLTFTREGAVTHFTLLWRNTGGGHFEDMGRINGQVPQYVADLDRDGNVDLVTVTAWQGITVGQLLWWRGLGSFRFAPGPAFPGNPLLHPYWDRVEVADFDRDGDLDLVGGSVGTSGVTSLLLNDGVGGFVQSNQLPATEYLNSVRRNFVRDIDGDGVPDLVVGQAASSLGTWFARGLPGGGFAPPVDQIVAPMSLVDIDGDGDRDAVTFEGIIPCIAIDSPDAGAIRQYGVGSPGTGGVVPTLGARGPMRGNVATETRLVGGVGGTFGVFVIGTQPVDLADTPLPGLRLFVAPIGISVMPLSGTTGEAGAGALTIPLVIPPVVAGLTIYEQFFLLDAAAPSGASASNGLALTFGAAR